MPEQQIKKRRNPEKYGRTEDSEKKLEDFFISGIKNQSSAIARWSLDLKNLQPIGNTPFEVAESLSTIIIEDSHISECVTGIISSPDEISSDDVFLLGSVALAKAEAREEGSFLTPSEKKNLSNYKDEVVSEIKKKLVEKKRRTMGFVTATSLVLTAACVKTSPSNPDYLPISDPVSTEAAYITPPTKEAPQTKEAQIAPSPTPENMKNISLTSVEVMTKEEIQANTLLSNSNLLEGISNYVQETMEIRNLSAESTAFELVVIKGMTVESNEMYFPFAVWMAQNKEGSTFVDMIGVAEDGLVKATLVHEEIEINGKAYYALVLQNVGPIFVIPASEIDNPETEISFSPSGKALETTEFTIRSKVLLALRPEIESIELTQEKIEVLSSQLVLLIGEKESGINESIHYPNIAHLELISSGVFENTDLINIDSGEVIGELTTLMAVSKDKNKNPIVVRIVLQAELFSNPGVNSYPDVYKVLLLMGGSSIDEVQNKNKLVSVNGWEEMMPKGSIWTFIINKNGVPSPFVASTYYDSPEYNQAITNFINSGGATVSEDLTVVPIGATDR